jgi:uncharacterized protein (TIGR00369 family)
VDRCRAVCAEFNAAPFYGWLGMRAESDAPGTARVALPFREELAQRYGGVHGGVLMTLADSALSVALATTFEGAETTATVQVSVLFVAPAGHADLVAEAKVTERGRRVAFAECVVLAADRPVLRAQGVLRIGSGAEPPQSAGTQTSR